MKVLLINPLFPTETYWSFKHALAFEGKKCAYPPLGLLTIAAMLPDSWELKLVDMEAGQKLSARNVLWADMVFVTGMLIQKESIHTVVDFCKGLGKKVAVGGPYISTCVEKQPNADYIFKGEVELTLPEFLEDLEMGIPQRVYEADLKSLPKDLHLTPTPRFDLVDHRLYGSMSIQYSRGCPFNCEFCDIIVIYGRIPRAKSNEQVIAELDALYATGYRGSLFIVDDNFIGNKKKVHSLIPELQQWQEEHHWPFSLITEASLNLADDIPLLEKMRDAGFYRVFLGIETPVEESLVETQKSQNTKRSLLDSVKTIQQHGIEVMAGFIVGFDNDPENIFDLQIKFINDSAIPLAMVGTMTALPETQLWKRLAQEGRLLEESSGNNAEGINFVPVMDRDVLLSGWHRILRTVYNPQEYYRRVLDCLDRFPKSVRPEPNQMKVWDKLKAGTKIALRLGLWHKGRIAFWQYAIAAMLDYPERFSQAMRLAVMGHHFRRIIPRKVLV